MERKVTVIARFKAREGADQELKGLLLALVHQSRSDEGCITYELHQAIDDPNLFIFYEIWESMELLDRHSATPHVRNTISKIKGLVAEPPEVKPLTKIS